jgi:hypothetical protein
MEKIIYKGVQLFYKQLSLDSQLRVLSALEHILFSVSGRLLRY